MTPAVSTSSICMDFIGASGSTRVLDSVSLNIHFGEMSMLAGPSGCGKTTLLSIITGILTPTAGSVTVDGTVVTRLRQTEKVLFRRKMMGFVFQQYNLIPALSATENAALPLLAAGRPLNHSVAQARQVLSQIGLESHLDKLPAQLSGGQMQRVTIARALVHEPALIVCDEPTAALDEQNGRLVMDILKQRVRQARCAVLVVTHDSRIFSYADRLFHMNDGRIIDEDTP